MKRSWGLKDAQGVYEYQYTQPHIIFKNTSTYGSRLKWSGLRRGKRVPPPPYYSHKFQLNQVNGLLLAVFIFTRHNIHPLLLG